MPAATRHHLAEAKLTYTEVGATAGELPAQYHHITRRVIVGSGHQVFADAANAVAGWQVQLRAGLAVLASSPTALAGTVAVLGLGIGPLRTGAPCRVVYMVEEPGAEVSLMARSRATRKAARKRSSSSTMTMTRSASRLRLSPDHPQPSLGSPVQQRVSFKAGSRAATCDHYDLDLARRECATGLAAEPGTGADSGHLRLTNGH